MHGHGAKGGAFVRLMPAPRAIRVYTPHGGSLHYGRHTLRGMVYGGLERILMRRTELFLFESQFARNAYQAMVGPPPAIVRVVPNGITAAEMAPVEPRPDAADLLSVGEFRHIKGTDVLIEAVAELHKAGRKVTLAMAGDGEEGEKLRELVTRLGLDASVRFLGHTPARQAFVHGRQMVVPSRADSLPYAVIEAGGAGIPMIASGVGGIPEILGPEGNMVPPENPDAARAGDCGGARRSGQGPRRRRQAARAHRASCSPRTPWSRACWPATARHFAPNSGSRNNHTGVIPGRAAGANPELRAKAQAWTGSGFRVRSLRERPGMTPEEMAGAGAPE